MPKYSIRRLSHKWSLIWNQWKHQLFDRYRLCLLFFKSHFYNSHSDAYYLADTILDPIFYAVDHYLKYCGTIFVLVVFFLLLAFISFAYIIGLL